MGAGPSRGRLVQNPKRIECLLADVREDIERTVGKLALPEVARGPVLAAASPGKMLRSWLLLAVAEALDKARPSHRLVSTSLELVHSASLLHDDVVDEAESRRGRPTLRARLGNIGAVLAGDLLVSTALEGVASLNLPRLDEFFASRIRTMCEGELKHEFASFEEDSADRRYMDVIRKKTGGLFSLAAAAPAIMQESDEDAIESLDKAGETIGVAYQLFDDLADLLLDGEELGKDSANDLNRAKPTLPLIRLARLKEMPLCDLALSAADPKTVTDLRREAAAANIIDEIIEEAQQLIAEASTGLESMELRFNPVTLFVGTQLAAYTERLHAFGEEMAASG